MKTIHLFLTMTALLGLAACGKGFSVKDPASLADGISQGQGGGSSSDWSAVQKETDSTIQGGTYDGQLTIQIDQTRQAILMTLPLPDIFLGSATEITGQLAQQLPGATIETNGNQSWVIVIPLKYLLRGANLIPFDKLPNGDALPFLPAGEIRGLALQFPQKPKYRLNLYVAASAAAVFIETPDWEIPPLASIIAFPVMNESKTKTIGYFKLIPNKSTYSSGVYLAAKLPSDITRLLGDLVHF